MTHRKLEPATSDSSVYRHTFYGILNAQGDFWTPLAFETERQARDHLRFFWRNDPENLKLCERTHKIVPVRVQLTQISDRDATPREREAVEGEASQPGHRPNTIRSEPDEAVNG